MRASKSFVSLGCVQLQTQNCAFACLREPFKDMNLSYGLTGFPLMPMTLAGPVRQASAAHTVEISWSRSGFRARIDGVMAKRAVYLPAAAQHAPPDHAHVFVWVQHRDSAKPVRLTPRLSLVRAQSVLFCQRCQRHHSLHQLSWERCLFCTAWLCQRHAGSPFCSECEHDYAGGTAALPQDVWSFVPLLHFAAAFPDLACLQATCQRLRAILLEERTWTAATLRIGLAKRTAFCAAAACVESTVFSRVHFHTGHAADSSSFSKPACRVACAVQKHVRADSHAALSHTCSDVESSESARQPASQCKSAGCWPEGQSTC